MDRGGKRSGSERGGQEPLERGFGLPDFGPARREEALGRVAAERVVVALPGHQGDFPGRDDVVAGAGALDAIDLFGVAFAEGKILVSLINVSDPKISGGLSNNRRRLRPTGF